jgi:branched-subunit amino acid aminotransferase/4-amino-4-deoxychorismate lyase
LRNFSVQEELIFPDELLKAEAIAITNSYLGIQPITQFETWTTCNPNLFKPIEEAYTREVADQLSRSLPS